MLSPFRAVAPFDTHAEAIAHIGRASGRPMSAKQKELAPLAPLFQACKARGLRTAPDNRQARIRAVNRYLDFLPFDWIESSFKELLHDRAAILVLADAVEHGLLKW